MGAPHMAHPDPYRMGPTRPDFNREDMMPTHTPAERRRGLGGPSRPATTPRQTRDISEGSKVFTPKAGAVGELGGMIGGRLSADTLAISSADADKPAPANSPAMSSFKRVGGISGRK